MIMHRVLDEVLRSWSHVAVLRALMDTSTGFTGNEVARVSGMQPRSALKALSSLEELGIVRRQRGGRDHLFTLNREHFLVREALLPI
ncbi:MAG: helix-turn-helix domain-containing protein [Bacteroidota bacterium]|jgi:DNA-binding transcriptional ArsR family regulator